MIMDVLDRIHIQPGQAAVILGVHRSTVGRMISDGRLRGAHLSGCRLQVVAVSDVLRHLLSTIEAGVDVGVDADRIRAAIGDESVG